MNATNPTAPARQYVLSSDLARLCLPQEYRDPSRRLAWVNSVCALFLVIGIVGLRPPAVRVKPLSEPVEFVPVVIEPVVEQPKPENPDAPPPEPDELQDLALETPVVATVVAANPAAVAFAVPVEGPVVLAPVRFAGPPPAKIERPPPTSNPTRYNPSIADWGGHPHPEYPPLALRLGYQGKVVLRIVVNPDGSVASVEIEKSSGYKILDNAALEHTRRHLRLKNPPGEVRVHTLEIEFRLLR
ncbi:MAG: energy transducer TonB [Verrucomicrobiales bacterium]|nr:energy transducer TonB [Verrucomicrobiales bacterium]